MPKHRPTIKCIENENGRMVTMYFSHPESNIEHSLSLKPILRNSEDLAGKDWPPTKLDFVAVGATYAPYIQGRISYHLRIEDIDTLIGLLNEAKEIMKKHNCLVVNQPNQC